jgi:hypothetical protein
MKRHMIDPPGGWKYGCPKEVPSPAPSDMLAWLVSEGYPQEQIDKMGDHFYCRHWEEEDDNTSE